MRTETHYRTLRRRLVVALAGAVFVLTANAAPLAHLLAGEGAVQLAGEGAAETEEHRSSAAEGPAPEVPGGDHADCLTCKLLNLSGSIGSQVLAAGTAPPGATSLLPPDAPVTLERGPEARPRAPPLS